MKRNFILGSEWLFVKLYCGYRIIDSLLIEKILPLALSLKKHGVIYKWFFIRYADPDFHLRLRFEITDKNLFHLVVAKLRNCLEPYILNDIIWKIQYDTYQREIERYGKDTIEIIEEIFHVDSEIVAKILSKLNVDKIEQLRWMLSIVLTDRLLSSFYFTLEKKNNVIHGLDIEYKNEFKFNEHQYKKQLDIKYRDHRAVITDLIELKLNSIFPYIVFITQRSMAIDTLAQEIRKKNTNKESQITYIVSSLVHMTMNRIFQTKNRLHEMVIYDFLHRFYSSEIIRSNASSSLPI